MTLNLTRLKLALGGVLLISAGIGAGSAFASTSSVDPQIDQEEAMELYDSTGDWGSAALQEYESRYGTLSEEQRQEFLQEEDLYQQRQEERYWEEFKIENPTWDITPIASGKARLKILVNVAKQRMSVTLDGKAVSGLQNIKVSTGKGNSTPKGTFSLARNEITKKRINRTVTKKLGHKVYLEDAIQVKGGIFLHKASTAAQKNTLGRKASHGCVRMDRNKSAKIFTLAKKYRSSAVAVIK